MSLALAIILFAQAAPTPSEDDLEMPAAPTTAPAPPGPTSPSSPAPPAVAPPPLPLAPANAPLEERIKKLEDRVVEDDTAGDRVREAREPSLIGGVTGPLGLVFSGYVQGQFTSNQASQDQLAQGGLPLNEDRFMVRRARLRVDRAWQWATTAIEIDGNTVKEPAFGLRRAEVSLLWRNTDAKLPPYVRLTGGLSEIPFGYELTDSARTRWFMERSNASLAFFPGEPDVGVRLSGGVAWFRYAIAVQNGTPIDDRPGKTDQDLNAAKDIVARVGIDTQATRRLRVSGDVSFLTGDGFHPGTDATKNSVIWRDLNGNGVIDTGELTAVPAMAATPSENFNRWAFGADVQLALDTKIGRSRLYGEVFVGQNADRGIFVADPIATGSNARELGWYVAFVQDVTKWGVAGIRIDYYDPNSDAFDSRGGKQIPVDSAIRTYSPMLGLILPDRARLMFQYDAIVDKLGRNAEGVPTDLKNNQITVRLQGEL